MNAPCQRLRTIAALCVSGRSIYKHAVGVLAFDQAADARSFQGGMPVIAHPPCRCWSKFCAHQARPKDRAGEMALGLWCVEQVLKCGGVLEHPAQSRLFEACQLPLPNRPTGNPLLYTVYLEQAWFGFKTRKPTWILVVGVPAIALAPLPMRFEQPGQWCGMSKFQRSRTMPDFAAWLIQTARASWLSLPVKHWTVGCEVSGYGARRTLAHLRGPHRGLDDA